MTKEEAKRAAAVRKQQIACIDFAGVEDEATESLSEPKTKRRKLKKAEDPMEVYAKSFTTIVKPILDTFEQERKSMNSALLGMLSKLNDKLSK